MKPTFLHNKPIPARWGCVMFLAFCWVQGARALDPVLTVEADKPGHDVSPVFFGLMTEEINHSYDGGLYAELIQNRIFRDDPKSPVHWTAVQSGGSRASVSLDESQPIADPALTTCLQFDAQGGGGIANDGFWGIPVRPRTVYRASFFAKTNIASGTAVTVRLESEDGATVFASAQVPKITDAWQRYNVTLTTANDAKPSVKNRFVIATAASGTLWFNLVSLFPPTFNNRPNGNRLDLMQLLVDLKPRFLRFPGGQYVEGDSFDVRFKWKETLGDLAGRPGHVGSWKYRSSDGMGLLEFLQWCEDLNMEPVLAVYAGYSRPIKTPDGGMYVTGEALKPFVDEALDGIEYITGAPTTRWGAERARDGHREPFKLNYIEVGNEDGADTSGSYESRFVAFHDAIKARYPQLKLIATVGGHDDWSARYTVKQRIPDLVDEHFYANSPEMQIMASRFDNYDREGPKFFVGEWSTHEGRPTTNLNAALGDAALMTGMERNSDVVVMQCYAPLFANVNRDAVQWQFNLIGLDALTSYGSPSYHAQKMFSQFQGDKVLPVKGDNVPTRTWQPPPRKGKTELPPSKQIPSLFYSATRDGKTGRIYLKLVNTAATEQSVQIEVKGAPVVAEGTSVVLTSGDLGDTNTVTSSTKVVPVTSRIGGLGTSFTRSLAPYSVNVLQLDSR